MIKFIDILKFAVPIASSILLDDNISPIKQENPYRPVIKNAIDTTASIVSKYEDDNKKQEVTTSIPESGTISSTSLFEIAKNMEYRYNL